jgi:hypothetical protein
MTPEQIAILSKEKQPDSVRKLLDRCNNLLCSSRRRLNGYYKVWDRRHEMYEAKYEVTNADIRAAEQGLPTGVSIPLGYSQVNAFVAYAWTLLTQRERFFETKSDDATDSTWRECGERLLHADMQRSEFRRLLMQMLLDMSIYNVGILKDRWEVNHVTINETREIPPEMAFGMELSAPTSETVSVRISSFEGNKLEHVSPYKFYTDANFPFPEWKCGEFAGCDWEASRSSVSGFQNDGIVAGIKFVPGFDTVDAEKAGRQFTRKSANLDPAQTLLMTEVQLRLVPSEIVDDAGVALGPETYPVLYVVWIANDTRIVRAEPMQNVHNQFSYSVGFFAPDNNTREALSLISTIEGMQKTISWFVNSRVAAVSRTIDNQLIVDPSAIDMASVKSRSRIILTQKGVARTDVSRYVKQIEVQDTTQNHVGDANSLISLMQLVTGINDNTMGQYNGGRRSATEARSVIQGAGSRIKMCVSVNWEAAFVPLYNRMLLNHRQFVSVERFIAVCGEGAEEYFAAFRSTPATLAGSWDNVPYDGTLPSEKTFMAQSLQELLGIVLTNPQAATMFNINPAKLLNEVYVLRGIGNIRNFSYSPEELAAQQQSMLAQQSAMTEAETPPAPQTAPTVSSRA